MSINCSETMKQRVYKLSQQTKKKRKNADQLPSARRTANPTPGHISEEKHDLKECRHPGVHCGTVYSTLDMEATSTSISWGMDKNVVQISSVAQLCPTLCNPTDCSTPGLPVHHQLPEITQTHVHRVGDAIQPSHPLSSPSPPTFNLSQHQGLFKWVSSSSQLTKVLEFQLQHQSFQWTPRTDLL